MSETIGLDQSAERVRQAVIRRGCSVTVGDIISETGLGANEAKEALDHLIGTHEGVMRVNEHGELMYVFSRGCIRRDYRSWWTRHKDDVLKIVKMFFKIIIFLVLVVYFIIYVTILIVLLTSKNDRRSSDDSFDFISMIYFFWGGSGYDNGYGSRKKGKEKEKEKRPPIYTSVYNFVFGPEDEKVDPLAVKSECAQLIRARRGVITLEDWLMVSGQTREKCESDLARYTAEFEGTVEITDSGTIAYVFENMMLTGKNANSEMPEMSWENFEMPRPLSGNVHSGDGLVILLNLFNMVMAVVITYGSYEIFEEMAAESDYAMSAAEIMTEQYASWVWWLGLFPFIFSACIFLGPLVRLPGNIKENRRRRRNAIRKALLAVLFAKRNRKRRLSFDAALERAKNYLELCRFKISDNELLDEVRAEYNALCYDFHGEMTDDDSTTYVFREFVDSEMEARKIRENSRFESRKFGEAVFSTDNSEQEEIEDRRERKDLSDFDKALYGRQSRSDDEGIDAPQLQSALSDWGKSMNGSESGRGEYDNGYGSQGNPAGGGTHHSEA